MCAKSLNLLCFSLFALLLGNGHLVEVFAYNLHPHVAFTLQAPRMLTQIPKTRSSYFGFSLVLHDKSIIVGAPRAQNPKRPSPRQRWSNETGVVWRCSLSTQQCQPFDLLIGHSERITTNQWLASTMDSAGHTDDDMLAVCAPRFAYRKADDMEGICYWSRDTRHNTINKDPNWEIHTFQLTPWERSIKGVSQTYWSHQGVSLHVVRNSTEILMGAIGTNLYTAPQTYAGIGEVYECLLTAESCSPFDATYNVRVNANRWLGATMDAGLGVTDDLVVCAPGFSQFYDNLVVDTFMQGICYNLKTTKRTITTISALKERSKQSDMGKYIYSLGESGFSVNGAANGRDFIIGAPGVSDWTGAVVFHNTASNRFLVYPYEGDVFSYFGYAVASGYLGPAGVGQKPTLLYVATAPRVADAAGEAFVMDKQRIRAILNGTQYGEYFGYAALVADVNGDGMDDILITAPQHFVKDTHDQYDNGAVYVFLNKGDTNFERSLIVSPFADAGRFGTTITNLGDINLDGYNDVAVGAPFANASGAVAIYLGSANGLSATPTQVLNGRNVLNGMFGHGLSKGVDIDGNGFNDLAVGAPEAETVYVYKAYPVVRIVASLQKKTLTLERKSGEKIILEVCHRIATNSTKLTKRNIKINFNMDAPWKRAVFNTKTPSAEHQVIVESTKTTQCFPITASTALIKMANRPLKVSMEYSLASTDTPDPTVDAFCDNCAVVDPSEPRSLSEAIPFLTDCGIYCIVEFKVSLIAAPTNVTLGIDKLIVMRYEVENSGQMSFDAILNVVAFTAMPFTKFPPMCTELNVNGRDKRELLCDLARTKEFQGKETLELIFDASGQVDEEELQVHVKIGSASGVENNKNDNEVRHTVQVLRKSYLMLDGKPRTNYIQLKNGTKVQEMQYDIKVSNQGPSALTRQRLYVRFPVAFKGSTDNDNLQLVNTTTMRLYTTAEGQNARYLDLELLKAGDTHTHVGQPRTDTLYESIANNQRVLSCHNTTNVVCVQAQMELQLSSGNEMAMSLTYELNAAIADYLTRYYDYLVLQLDLTLDNQTPPIVTIEQNKNIETTVIVNLKPQKTPLWVYILSVIGGFVLLLPIIWGLQKAKFFKRQTQEDMEEILQKKAMRQMQ